MRFETDLNTGLVGRVLQMQAYMAGSYIVHADSMVIKHHWHRHMHMYENNMHAQACMHACRTEILQKVQSACLDR